MNSAQFTDTDSIDDLTKEQLEFLTETDSSWLVSYIDKSTRFDAQQIRLMLDLGKIEANKRLDT